MELDELGFTALRDAVIHVESRGRASAIGPDTKGDKSSLKDNAKGLMQLMDPTGREWHSRLGIEEAYNPFDPVQNVRLGSGYLKDLIRKYKSIPLALAAYNWGPGNVSAKINDARERYGSPWPDLDKWEVIRKRVPRVTREYVDNVLMEYERRLALARTKTKAVDIG